MDDAGGGCCFAGGGMRLGGFGRLESKVLSAGTSENGIFICYVTEEDVAKIKTGMLVKVNGNDFAVT